MKRKYVLLLWTLIIILLVGGCSNEIKQITYSNLMDTTTQNKIGSLLVKNGIKETDVDTFLVQVKDYNELMGAMSTSKDGFIRLRSNSVPYDGGHTLTTWANANRNYSDLNSRVTAFELYKDFIECTNKEEIIQDFSLLFDFSIIDNHPLADVDKNERATFIHLYEAIPFEEDIDTVEKYPLLIEKVWEERGIGFTNGLDMTMINTFVPNTDTSELFVAHAGILIDIQRGYLFIEKYAPLFPYQVTYFKNKKMLENYLITRLQNEYGENNTPFIVMENSNRIGD